MILSDTAIRQAMSWGEILIDPFDPKRLGANSYDMCLGDKLITYYSYLDAAKENPIVVVGIPAQGRVLFPGNLYLAATKEYTETHKHVPFLDGKSSIGRLGIAIHCTAGRGDVGFCGHWTMEISVVQPVRIYAGMLIGQLIFFEVSGEISERYNEKASHKYGGRDPMPQPSRMWQNFGENK